MAHHDPFKSLGPIDWSTVTDQEAAGSLPALRASTLADAQTLINSIPGAAAVPPPPRHTTGRARAATDSAVDFDSNSNSNSGGGADALLRREWKAVRAVGDNPHLISVHRLAGRDGRGAWFARRSVHPCRASGGLLGFGRWREGLEGEFEETMRRAREGGGEPGTGNVRGIGAERRVEERDLGGGGALKVYQLSARFPGPTTPRDFVTLLLTSNDPQGDDDGNNMNRRPRQFMVISKPCIHPDCPQRQGFVRGQYESVEVVREIPVDKPLRRVRSSIDLGSDAFSRSDSGNPGKGALLRSARQTASNSGNLQARPDNRMVSFAAGPVKESKSEAGSDDEDEPEMAIEWLMITRSDPGGSVPRFMVERGTPPGIVNDAGRLLDWLSRKQSDTARREAIEAGGAGGADADEPDEAKTSALPGETKMMTTNPGQARAADEAPNAGPGGFYGMITSALEAAGSAVVGKLHDAPDSYQGTEDDDEDDTSSSASFASAEEGEPSSSIAGFGSVPADEVVSSSRSARSAVSGESQVPSAASTSAAQRDKTLRKLEERHRKAREKAAREHERALAKRKEGEEKDAQAAARLRDKHEKELARREEKYMREVRKLEEKRARAAEREGRAGLQAELERTRAERDVALKQVEMLRDQVGELQTQNTRLVARMGKMGGMAGAEASWDDLRKAPGQETKARSHQD